MRACPCQGLHHGWGPFPQDEVLPPVHMRQLYEAVGGPACTTCRWVEFPQVWSQQHSLKTCCATQAQHCSAKRLPLLHAWIVWSGMKRRRARPVCSTFMSVQEWHVSQDSALDVACEFRV